MRIVVLNCGSSSVKATRFEGASRERAGDASRERVDDFAWACAEVLRETGAAAADAIGHRVVHGGPDFAAATLVDDAVLARIEALRPLAPLHLAPGLEGLRIARGLAPTARHVAVFDTAFFRALPPAARHYAVPWEWTERFGVVRYGFHGTSHRGLARRAAVLTGVARPNLVTLHLGAGCSMACVRNGAPIDTTMGMTPLEGLVMGTRSGDLDPAIAFHLMERGVPARAVHETLERGSGLLGLSGVSADVRDVERAAAAGDARAALALDVFAHRVRRYLGAFLLPLDPCHAVVLSGGIGEHAAGVRARILDGLAHAGIVLDDARNAAATAGERRISADASPIPVWVVPADEAATIAEEVAEVLRR